MATKANPTVCEPLESDSPEQTQRVLERVLCIYQRNFHELPNGKEWMVSKKLGDVRLLEVHGVGYCDGTLTKLLPKPDQDPSTWDQLKSIGIFSDKGHEAFCQCIVFPLYDLNGNLKSACAIELESDSRKPITLLARTAGLWNAPVLKRCSELIMVGSILDGLSAEAAGAQNVVACVAPEGLSEGELEWFRSNHIQRIKLFYSTKRNPQAAQKLLTQLASFGCERCELPDNLEINEFLVAHGAAALAQALANARVLKKPVCSNPNLESLPDGFEVILGSRHYQVRGLDKGPRKLRATVRIEQAGNLHVDTLDFYSARWRRRLIADVARIFEETAEKAESEVMKLIHLCCVTVPQLCSFNSCLGIQVSKPLVNIFV
jgi:hypothetical protein